MSKTEKLFNLRPLVAIAIVAVFSIIIAVLSNLFIKWLIWLVIATIIIATILLSFIKSCKKVAILLSVFTCTFTLIGCITYYRADKVTKYLDYSDYGMVVGKVFDVKVYEEYNLSVYKIKNCTISGEKLDCSIEVPIYNDSNYQVGDILSFNAKLSGIDKDEYLKYASNGVGLIASSVSKVSVDSSKYNFFEKIRSKIKQVVIENAPYQAGFCYAILVADTSHINSGELENFRYSGVAHIFAVSGLHIGFLVAFLSFVLERIKVKRLAKTLLIFIIALTYSGICGFSASSLRAVIMSTVYLVSRSLGRKYDGLNSIALSMLVVLSVNPFDLFSVGFMFSFASVLSIATLSKTFENIVDLKNKKLRKAISVGLSVQMGTLPLACYCFGYTSVLSLVLNIVIVPIISFVYPLLFVFVAICCIIPQASVLLFIPSVIINLVCTLINFFEFGKLVSFVSFSIIGVVLYYAILTFATDQLNYPKKIKVISLIASLALVLVFSL